MPAGTGHGFHEYARRPGDFALAAAAATVGLGADGAVGHASLAASAAKVAQKLPAAEAVLVGRPPTEDVITQVIAAARGEIDPVSDIHADAEYRTHLVGVLLARAIRDAASSAKGAVS